MPRRGRAAESRPDWRAVDNIQFPGAAEYIELDGPGCWQNGHQLAILAVRQRKPCPREPASRRAKRDSIGLARVVSSFCHSAPAADTPDELFSGCPAR